MAGLFEQQFSAETVRRYKPARETYQMVAQRMDAAVRALVIASHPWDLIGAHRRLLGRPNPAEPLVALLIVPGLKQPQIIAPNLTEIATQLVQLKHA